MALPSAFTLASAAAVVVAGIWLAASASSADHAPRPPEPVADPHPDASRAHHGQTVAPHSHATPKPKRDRRTSVVPRVLVEVYNNSAVQGLAGTKAAALRGAGWNVAAVDNWHGDIPANTVYYPPRLRSAAHQLASALSVRRLRPAVAPMQFDRLTVIFTGG
jgi:LytR cell envelope-related transcriptional attenuator